jgi:ABC-type glycerol-3-phosphate transport system substrate-binding protein
VHLSFWTWMDPKGTDPRSQAFKENLAQFHAENPKIRIDVNTLPPAEIDPQLVSAVASGKGPDLVHVFSPLMTQHAKGGTIIPLDKLAAGWSEERRKDFAIQGLEEVDGKRYGVVLELRPTLLQYNADLLDGGAPPTSLEELRDLAKKIGQGGVVGFALGMSEANRADHFMDAMPSIVWSAGGELVNKDGTAAYDSAEGARAFQYVADLVKDGVIPKDMVTYGMDELQTAVQAGKVGMTVFGSQRVSTMRSSAAIKDSWKTAPVPAFGGGPAPTRVVGWSLAMSPNVKDDKAAWKFIDFMSDRDAQLRIAAGGEVPARSSVYDDPFFATDAGLEKVEWLKYIQDHGRAVQWPTNFVQFAESMARAIQAIILEDVPAAEALKRSAEEYNSTVK